MLARFGWWASPTASFWLLALVVFAMWYAAVSQANSVAYLISFTIASAALVSCLHAVLLLRRVEAAPTVNDPIISGGVLVQGIQLHNGGKQHKAGLQVGFPARYGWTQPAPVAAGLLRPGEKHSLTISAHVQGRGRHPLDGVVLQTTFPLGLLRVSRWLPLEGEVLVYPKPEGHLALRVGEGTGGHSTPDENAGVLREGDNFAGLRNYRLGDSQRHVDWKAVARGQPMLTKEFVGSVEEKVWLEWQHATARGTEAKLCQMARWIQLATEQGLEYGLRIPGLELPPSSGSAHYHRCMRELALFTG